jgi:hypothetical protein
MMTLCSAAQIMTCNYERITERARSQRVLGETTLEGDGPSLKWHCGSNEKNSEPPP